MTGKTKYWPQVSAPSIGVTYSDPWEMLTAPYGTISANTTEEILAEFTDEEIAKEFARRSPLGKALE